VLESVETDSSFHTVMTRSLKNSNLIRVLGDFLYSLYLWPLVLYVMAENDVEEKFYTAYSSIRSVISIAMSVPNSPSLDVVHNFIYRKQSSSLVKNNVFTVTSEGHVVFTVHCRGPGNRV